MAPFNPSPNPTQDPNYIGWSKTIEQPKSDTSTGILLTGVGQALDTGVTALDSYVKQGIDKSLYDQIDTKRDALTADLKAYQAGQTVTPTHGDDPTINGVPNTPQWAAQTYGYTPQAGQGPQSLLSDAQASDTVPPALKNGLDRASTLGSASAGNPHISQTLYDGQLDAIAKNMRAQFPGYRPYIDQQMSLITGKNPANAQISGLIEDINRGMTSQREMLEKPANQLRTANEAGVPGADDELRRYNANPTAPGAADRAYSFVNRAMAYKYKYDTQTDQANLDKSDQAADKVKAQGQASEHANFVVNTKMDSFMTDIGLGHPVKMNEAIEAINNHSVNLTQPQKVGMAQAVDAAENQTLDYLNKAWDAPGKNGTPSLTTRLGGPDEKVKMLTAATKRFEDMKKSVTDGSFGTLAYQTQLNTAMETQTKSNLYNDQLYGDQLLALKTINEIDPKGGESILTKIQGSQVPHDYKPLVGANTLKMYGQPGATKGNIFTISDAINDGKGKIPDALAPQIYSEYLSKIKDLSSLTDKNDPDGQLRSNLIHSFFSPKNADLLDNFNMDYTDGKGNKIPGKFAVFTRNTSPDITNAAWEAGKKNPADWDMYKSWAEDTFGKKLLPTIQDLDQSATPGKHSFQYIDLHYDPNTHHIEGRVPAPLASKLPEFSNPSTANRLLYTFQNKRISDLNMGLDNLSRIAERSGMDIDQYLIDNLQKLHMDVGNISGVPAQMIKAIEKSRGPERMDDTFGSFDKNNKAVPPTPTIPLSKFADDTPDLSRGSLSAFLRNPSGSTSNANNSMGDLPRGSQGVIKGNLSDEPMTGMSTESIPAGAPLGGYYYHRPRPIQRQ